MEEGRVGLGKRKRRLPGFVDILVLWDVYTFLLMEIDCKVRIEIEGRKWTNYSECEREGVLYRSRRERARCRIRVPSHSIHIVNALISSLSSRISQMCCG